MCPNKLTNRKSNSKSAAAPKHTQKAEPHSSSSSSSHSSSSALPAKSRRRVRRQKGGSSHRTIALENVNSFAKCLLDPEKHVFRYPQNKFETNIAKQRICFLGNTYSDEGSVNVYATNDPEYPIAVSALTSKNYPANTHPAFVITQPIDVLGGTQTRVYAALQIEQALLFNAPVAFNDGTTLPGYHMSVTGAALSLTVTHGPGISGTWTTWHRLAGAVVNVNTTINPSSLVSTVSIPSGATAFGFSFVLSENAVDRYTIASSANTASVIDIGNHASYAYKKSIPDLVSMSIRHARVLGLRVWIEFQGSDLNNGGRIATAQFPPGVHPGQYPGRNAYEQILNSRLRQSYHGHIKNGACFLYLAPDEKSYSLQSPGKKYGEDGFAVASWYSVVGTPQPYAVFVDLVIEFTSSSTAFDSRMPAYADMEYVTEAMRTLSCIQLHTENPLHEHIMKLWEKVKGKAHQAIMNPSTWFTIAEVVGGALLL